MLQNSSRRKRQERPLCEDPGPQPKKPKLCSPARPASPAPAPPVHSLDTLSKIWLTGGALRELDRRTRRIRPNQRRRPENRRPLTRVFHAELRSEIRSTQTPASNFLHECTPETLKELKLFAKHGGPNLLDLRGLPEPAHPSRYTMSSTQSSRRHKRGKRGLASASRPQPTTTDTTATKVTKSSGSRDANFYQRMIDNGIYPDGYEYPDGRVPPEPEEWKEIQQMLAERRPSLSPSVYPEEKFREFKRADARVSSERKATEEVIPIIQGTTGKRNSMGRDIMFNNLSPMMRGPNHSAKPDTYYGARPEQLNEEIRKSPDEKDDDDTRKKKLGKYIVPSTTGDRPFAPNFFVETKGPSGSARVCLGQACFVGAAGARGIHKLQTYGQQVPTYNDKAYTLSTTYYAGTLKIYAHHPAQPDGPSTDSEYYMNQLKAYAMTSDRETLVKGITAFRNAEAWTEAQRNAAIEHANAVWHTEHQVGVSYANAVATGELGEEEDAENEQTDEEENDEEDDAVAVSDPILSSFTSQSPFSAGQSTSRKGKAIHQESDTSADEPTLDFRTNSRSTATRQAGSYQRRAGERSSAQKTGSTTYATGGR